jgi:putative ABC transport system permease protein
MLGHYLLLAIRAVPRAGSYVAVSIAGLALGLGAALLIALYVHDEASYDRWWPNVERIYQISVRSPDGSMTPVGPSDIGKWVAAAFPQFETVTRLAFGDGLFRRDDREFAETIMWADSNVFEVFAFPLVAGSLEGALEEPGTLVLTREVAERHFGRADAIGETLVLDDEHAMTVTAVVENLPSNTHLEIDVLAAGHSTYSPLAQQDLIPLTIIGAKRWGVLTYGVLARNESIEPLRESIRTLGDRHSVTNEGVPPSDLWPLIVRPITAIHLSAGDVAQPESMDRGRLYGALGIGVLVLLAACINFVTLRTALAVRRSLEVGVRKTLGASRGALFGQFMSEVFVHVCVATAVGIGIAAAALPALNAFLLRTIDAGVLASAPFLAGIVASVAIVTLIAGSYPALVLASFNASAATRARGAGRRQNALREALVALQFAIVAAVLIATAVVHRQMAFGQREALRQLSDPIVVLTTRCSESFEDAMARVEGVVATACSSGLPQAGAGAVGPIQYGDNEQLVIGTVNVGIGFFELYDLPLVAGRFFSEDFGTDVTPRDNIWTSPEAIVLNESAVANLGFAAAAAAIGATVKLNHVSGVTGQFTGVHDARIIGVVADFQMGSVRSDIYSSVFFVDPWLFGTLSLKLDGRALPETLDAIDRLWAEMGSPGPPNRVFFEESVEEMYRDLRRDFQLFTVFAGVAITISILGLVGLAAHTVVARTKEIGIRKVLGSGRGGIMRLLMWQFGRPVLVANLIAWPAAYIAMSRWLEGFARRIELEPWIFVAAAVATLAVALATVLVHTWSIAGIRPVVALRHE